MLLLFKLLITPVLIGSVTLAGRRWGPAVNGLLVGLPLTSGPISFILAHQYGLAFAAQAAVGNLAGQVSMCIFCLVYSLVAQKTPWLASALISITAFLLATLLLNHFTWQLFPAFVFLLATIMLVVQLIPRYALAPNAAMPPKWDLPARMIVATLFVILLTTFASVLGPQLSGLLAPFPIFGVVFATFTHAQQGPRAAANLLRGIVLGSLAYTFFFLTVGAGLTHWGVPLTYSLALIAALSVSGVFYFLTSKIERKTQ
jgi:hypothetical protein